MTPQELEASLARLDDFVHGDSPFPPGVPGPRPSPVASVDPMQTAADERALLARMQDDEDQGDGSDVAPESHEAQVFHEYSRMLVREEARAMLDRHKAAEQEPFSVSTLGELLKRPPSPIDRVEGLIPWEGSTVIVAQRKTGKTTFVLNLVKSLLSGEDFLGRFPVQQVTGKVAVLSFEMSDDQLARWADEIGCPHDDVLVVSLRGRPTPFGNAEREAELGGMLRPLGVEVVVVDTFARSFPGDSQNDSGQVSQFLNSLDVFARQTVGASDVLLTVHAGWTGERSRGSSALEDWPDSIIVLTKDDKSDERFMKAMGRDVDYPETLLLYDEDTRLLTLGEGSRKQASQERKMDELLDAVLKIVGEHPGMNGAEIEKQMRVEGVSFQRGDHSKVLKIAVERDLVTKQKGKGREFLYNISSNTPRYPNDTPRGNSSNTPIPLYRERGITGGIADQVIPRTVREICKPGIDQAARRHQDMHGDDMKGTTE